MPIALMRGRHPSRSRSPRLRCAGASDVASLDNTHVTLASEPAQIQTSCVGIRNDVSGEMNRRPSRGRAESGLDRHRAPTTGLHAAFRVKPGT